MKFPTEILDDRLAITGTTGSGKTVTAKLGVEKLLKAKARACVVDPTGAWWGLRLGPDGTTEGGFKIVIFGGNHGDLPLTPSAGKMIGEIVAGGDFSCIIDVSEFSTMADRRKFMRAFAEAIYEKNRAPLHLILDEADLWAPQKPLTPDATILGSRIDEIARRGRIRGFTVWLLTQRPAVINKDILSQIDTLVAMKLTSSHDRDALGAWVEGNADRAQWKEMRAALPGMARGTGVVWAPSHGLFSTMAFDMHATFDSSRSPKRGEKRPDVHLSPMPDLDKLREALAKVDEEAKANDPAALRAEIARLKRDVDLLQKNPAITVTGLTNADMDRAHALGKLEGEAFMKQEFSGLLATIQKKIIQAFTVDLPTLIDDAGRVPTGARAAFERAKAKGEAVVKQERGGLQNRQEPRQHRPASPAHVSGSGLAKMDAAVMTALAQWRDGLTIRQLNVRTGYSMGTGAGSRAMARMRANGWVQTGDGRSSITEAGLEALGPYEALPTGDDLLQFWLGRLNTMESRFLDTIARNTAQGGITVQQLSEITGNAAGTGAGSRALAKLRGLDLISGKPLQASEDLFS